MLSRVWKVLHPLLTLLLLACFAYLLVRPAAPIPVGRDSEQADNTLRTFLYVRHIGGDYELPPGENFAVISLMEFVDGQFKQGYYKAVWDVSQTGRVCPAKVMWGKTPDGPRLAIFHGGVTIHSGDFAVLDGPSGRIGGSTKWNEVNGFRAIGFASSADVQPGQERFKDVGGLQSNETIQVRKRVLVFGVKPFPDRNSAEQFVKTLESDRRW